MRGARIAGWAAAGLGLAASGGTASAVASRTTYAIAPVRLAYITETVTSPAIVWLARANGTGAVKLGAGNQPLIAPDAGEVAAGLGGSRGAALAIYRSSGGVPHRFFNAAKVYAVPEAWSPDSRYLAVELVGTNVRQSGSGLAVVDTRGWKTRVIARGIISGASFDPVSSATGPDKLVFGAGTAELLASPVDLYMANTIGQQYHRLTTDGHSLDPVWGASGIVFVRERLRGRNAPAYQLWLRSGSRTAQLTNMNLSPLVEGLVPIGVSRDGNHVLAEFEGTDTSDAWTVQIHPLRVSPVMVAGETVQGGAISASGKQLFVSVGSFEQPASHGTVELVPFSGGHPVKVTRGSEPSSNF